MENGLTLIETTTAALLFTPGGIEPILERIEREAREEASQLDIATAANRKALNSLAFKVTKSKTFLESKRKELVSDEKKRLALIDEQGKVSRDRLDKLAEEIRKPLTDWEDADKLRVLGLEAKVSAVNALGVISYGATVSDLEDRLAAFSSIDLSNMQEFASRASLAASQTEKALALALQDAKQREADRVEAERLRAEAIIREQKDREDKIAREAREKAQRETEEERRRIEEDRFKAEARAKQAEAEKIAEAERADREAKAAEERRIAEAAKAEQDAQEAAKRHAEEIARLDERRRTEAKQALEKAEHNRLRAIEAERQRAANELARVEAEAKARERDKAHKAEIHSGAMIALTTATGIPRDVAKEIVIAIAKGAIPNVKITY